MIQTTTSLSTYAVQPVLYMAMEVSSRQWKLAFALGYERPRIRTVKAGDLSAVGKEIWKARERLKLDKDAPVYSCYEAGRDGFWIHRELVRRHWNNIIVDPASIEVDRRRRRRKTDRLDAEGLVRRLVRWVQGDRDVWRVVQVPSAEHEDQRRLHRERARLVKEKTGHLARIRSLLATQGPVPRKLDEKALRVVTHSNARMPKRLAGDLRREWERLELVKRHLREVIRIMNEEEAEPTEEMSKVRTLKSLRGIGPVFARVLVTEFFGWRSFSNRRQVGSLAGVTGTPYASGDIEREQGISKAGNRWVRSMIIEMAWMWLRHQPDSAISIWYRSRFGDGARARKIGIVGVARRVLIALWRFVEHGQIPEGAVISGSE